MTDFQEEENLPFKAVGKDKCLSYIFLFLSNRSLTQGRQIKVSKNKNKRRQVVADSRWLGDVKTCRLWNVLLLLTTPVL
jgi:hypothetical protein